MSRLHLEARQHRDCLAIGVDHRRRNVFPGTIAGQKIKQRRVAEILFQVGAAIQILSVNFRHGKAMLQKMPCESEEGGVLLANVVQDADGALLPVGEADNFASRAAQFSLQLDYTRGRTMEMLFEEGVENVHICFGA